MSQGRILFVDDDPQILQGLRNSLYRKRKDWDMVFVTSGESALAEFDACPFDVVVSDMRMPSMDGAALLVKVRERYPDAIRIVLSGYAERESILRTLPVSHQFLSKPCDGDNLTRVLENGLTLRALLINSRIRRLVGELNCLPAVPATYNRLIKAIENPLVSSTTIAEIIESDAALSVKVLQLVNSAYFGLARETSSVAEAVTFLGVETMKMLALTAGMFTMARSSTIPDFSWDALQRRSFTGGRMARLVNTVRGESHEILTAALLRDIGQVILAVAAPDEFRAVQARIKSTGEPRHMAEHEILGFNHAQVGAYLLGLWGLPFTIVIAVAYHHSPQEVAGGGLAGVLGAVHMIDALVDETLSTEPGAKRESSLQLEFIEMIGLADRLPAWRTAAAAAAAVPLATLSGG